MIAYVMAPWFGTITLCVNLTPKVCYFEQILIWNCCLYNLIFEIFRKGTVLATQPELHACKHHILLIVYGTQFKFVALKLKSQLSCPVHKLCLHSVMVSADIL